MFNNCQVPVTDSLKSLMLSNMHPRVCTAGLLQKQDNCKHISTVVNKLKKAHISLKTSKPYYLTNNVLKSII